MRKRLRLLHTSDIHLGMTGDGNTATRAMEAVVHMAIGVKADALLLVGDVFDNSRVSDDLVDFFMGQVDRLGVPAVLLPGNHDCYDESSVYLRERFRAGPENLHLICREEGETISFPGLSLDVWGRAMIQHTPEFRPLAGMPPRADGNWYVALAHGHFHYDHDRRGERSSPIFPEDIAHAPCDYIALGHWDRHVDVSQNGVRALYSGSPASRWNPEQPGCAAMVDLDPDRGVEIRSLTV